MAKGNVLIGQSGGPTSVINSSLAADTVTLNHVKVPLRAIFKSFAAEAFVLEAVVRHATDAAATNLRVAFEYAYLP